jgi:hypothetical protein
VAEVVLELACGRCGEWWIRWTVDPDRPFDEQLLTSAAGAPYLGPDVQRPGVVTTDLPGSYYRASDGNWCRWAPGAAAALPMSETYARYRFACGHPTDTKPRVHKLDEAAVRTVRALHSTRTPLTRTTVDKLLALQV